MELGFLIGFSFCAIILLLILRWAKIHWGIKAALTVCVIPVIILLHQAFLDSQGFPANNDIPYDHVLRMIASEIREPTNTDKGAIYIWYVNVDEERASHKPVLPRAVVLPYSKPTSEKMFEAEQRSKIGIISHIKLKHPEKPSSNDNIGKSSGAVDFVPPPYTIPEKPNM